MTDYRMSPSQVGMLRYFADTASDYAFPYQIRPSVEERAQEFWESYRMGSLASRMAVTGKRDVLGRRI